MMLVMMTMLMKIVMITIMFMMTVGDDSCLKALRPKPKNGLQGAPAHEHGHRPGQAEASPAELSGQVVFLEVCRIVQLALNPKP